MAVFPPGLGNDQQATQATAAMRQSPWYLQWLKSQGITPGPDQQVKLTDNQRAQLMALAVKNGIGFNDTYDMIDENGQIAEEHHKLKKIAIAAALAGLAVTGLGAAGIGPLAGALGGGTAAATGATAGVSAGLPGASATLPAVASAAMPTVAGGGAAALAGFSAPAAASVAAPAATTAVSSWLKPALSIGVPVAGQLISAGMQASASKDAAELQAKAFQDALDFEKAQYADLTKRLDPYIAAGGASSDRMAQLLGLPPRAGTTATAPPTRGPALEAAPASAPNRFGVAAAGGTPTSGATMVTLTAPDGTTKQVPESQAEFFIAKGAKRMAA